MTEQDITGGLSQTLKPGSSIGSYVVQREIGRGGFGVVYEARHKDPSLNWRVAVKELFPQALVIRVNDTVICTNPNIKPVFDRILDKFVETTAILHNLEHRNIVRVRDLERAHGTAYMVMDYVEGVNFLTWRRNLGRQPTPEEIRQIFEPIFQAIAYMHGKGLL
ncbi:MAG TPA: protein kinase, partial [Hyphomicrobiales bacterium]|nr:protein kinase [Hyphomicrobiales bacterium]